MVVSSPQCLENTAFFSYFPLGGIHGQGIFPFIHLEFQEKKTSTIFYNTALKNIFNKNHLAYVYGAIMHNRTYIPFNKSTFLSDELASAEKYIKKFRPAQARRHC